jgi:hypothetical protein
MPEVACGRRGSCSEKVIALHSESDHTIIQISG